MVFREKYTNVYDSLYQSKDYEKECDFVEKIFRKQDKNVKTILDLGCGTGGHAVVLAKRGYKVTGVDRSEEMLKVARRKSKHLGLKINFHRSSIQDLKLNEKFDAVISMFAVISYQTDNKDLAMACKNAKQHLKRGGVFIFDVWNGLAVMIDPPAEVGKEVRNGDERILRFTKPGIDVLHHTVDVNFKVLKFKGEKVIFETEELHKMRFLYPQEIKYFLQVAGFSEIEFCPFLKPEEKLSIEDWNMAVIAS